MKHSLSLLGIILLIKSSLAQEPRVYWGNQFRLSPQPIIVFEQRIEGKRQSKVTFPQPAKTIQLGNDESATVSKNGQLVLIYNWQKQEAVVYDSTGIRRSQFQTDYVFAHLEISDSGLIVMSFGYEKDRMPKEMSQTELRLYDVNGRLLYRLDRRLLISGTIHTKFSPDGRIAALLGIVSPDPEKPAPHAHAVLLDDRGEILHRSIEGEAAGGIHFGSRNRFAFTTYRRYWAFEY